MNVNHRILFDFTPNSQILIMRNEWKTLRRIDLDFESKLANVNSNLADSIDHGYGTIILAVKIRKYHRRKD